MFCQQAPECRVRVEAMCNGVDADYFSSDPSRPSPYKADELPVVFTGAMDYLPNVDAVAWFKHEVLPDVLKRWPNARFYIVGRSPTPAVLALASDQVVVTGTVPDVRPYLQHAAAVVAPLRIARGIQNKILEAMAMAKPVIASVECAAAVDAAKGTELLTADNPAAYIAELGSSARRARSGSRDRSGRPPACCRKLQLGSTSGSHRPIPPPDKGAASMTRILPPHARDDWRKALLLLLATITWVLFWYWDTARAMVAIWARSDTYAHAFIVPPISLWLIWRKRHELARLKPEPTLWLVLPLIATTTFWLMGELTAVNALTQFALIVTLILAIISTLGLQVSRQIAFPLAFLLLSVPVGDFMMPKLMEWTAWFTVLALRASGIPVYQEGLQFVIPSGNWSVVEACSGIRYIIASVTVGTLFAYLNYVTLRRG